MNFDNTKPVYLQLCDILIQDIINGKYKTNEKIPSIKEFAKKYIVNQNTVIHAYKELENMGIIVSQRGLGYFIVDDKHLVKSFSKDKINQAINDFLVSIKQFNISKEELIEYIKEVDFDAIN